MKIFKNIDFDNFDWQKWQLFLIGFIVAALFLPFNVIISSNEGLLNSNFVIVNKYFYQLSVLISGFGSSLSYLFKNKFKKYSRLFLIYLAIAPIVALFFSSIFFNNIFGVVANPTFLIFSIVQIIIITWFFIHGAVTSIFLQEFISVRVGWGYHLLGLILGYLLSYYILDQFGIIPILLLIFFLSIQLVKLDKISILFGIGVLTLIPFLTSKFRKVSMMKNLNISLEVANNYSDERKGAFNRKFSNHKTKIVFYNFGVRGLTEVIKNEDRYSTLYINKYHTFTSKNFDSHDINRGVIYNELFTSSNRKAIIGVGGARSLTYVESKKVANLDAIEINKDTITYVQQMSEPIHDKINKINYLNLDGRFYVDTLPNQFLDVLIYEGATLQAQAVQSAFLKPNFLSNTDSISNAVKKIKPDGYLIFERTQMYSGLKLFQFKTVLDSLINLGLQIRVLGDLKNDNYYIIANKNSEKLSVVDNILNTSKDLMEINYKRMSFVTGKKFSHCAEDYNDNYPFLGIKCNNGKEQIAIWPIIMALTFYILTLVCIIFYSFKKENNLTSAFNFVFIQGLVQSVSFSFLQFKFDSFLWDDNLTLVFLIIASLIFSYWGNRYFAKFKINKYALNTMICCYLLTVLMLPNFNTYNIESINFRVFFLVVLISIFNFLIGGVFSSILSLENKENVGKLLFADSLGLFLGYLSNYFILRVFGFKLFSIYLSLIFIVFIYFIYKYKNKFIFYSESNQ